MLNILLLILKITGIILLILIGTVLLLVLMILFIPVRYSGNAKKGAEAQMPEYAGAKAGWLLNMITACYEYRGGNTALTVKVFGIRLKSREEKEERKRQRRAKREKSRKDISYSMLEYDESSDSIAEKPVNARGKTHIYVDEHKEDSDITEVSANESEAAAAYTGPGLEENVSNENTVTENTENENTENENTVSVNTDNENDLYDKICAVYDKLSSSIGRTLNNLTRSVNKVINKLTGINEDISYYKNALFNDARNREVIDLLIREIKRVLKAIAPRRIRGHLRYGSDDPADTGKFLAGAAMLYPFYHGKVSIIPVFDDKILEFDLVLKGRIYIGTLVAVLLKLYFNKKVKRFIHIMKKENANG